MTFLSSKSKNKKPQDQISTLRCEALVRVMCSLYLSPVKVGLFVLYYHFQLNKGGLININLTIHYLNRSGARSINSCVLRITVFKQ